jgi:hypothetical protein
VPPAFHFTMARTVALPAFHFAMARTVELPAFHFARNLGGILSDNPYLALAGTLLTLRVVRSCRSRSGQHSFAEQEGRQLCGAS